MKRAQLFIHKFLSIFGYRENQTQQADVLETPNPIPQPIISDNQVSVFEESVVEDTTNSTVTSTTENNPLPLSSSENIEFTEIEPISITEVQSLGHDIVMKTNKHDSGFDKLLATTIDTIKYYDQIAEQLQNPDAKTLLNDVCAKLIENLILSGCTPINEPTGIFDMIKHKVIPFQIVPEGTTYTNLVRPGIEYDGEVKILAIVKL